MLARLLLNPWGLALGAGALAAFLGWVALHQRDAKMAAQRDLAAAERVVGVLNTYAVDVVSIETALRDSLEVLNGIPDTQGCGPSVGAALNRLRQSQ